MIGRNYTNCLKIRIAEEKSLGSSFSIKRLTSSFIWRLARSIFKKMNKMWCMQAASNQPVKCFLHQISSHRKMDFWNAGKLTFKPILEIPIIKSQWIEIKHFYRKFGKIDNDWRIFGKLWKTNFGDFYSIWKDALKIYFLTEKRGFI